MTAAVYRRALVELELDRRRRELASVTGQPLADVAAACKLHGQPLIADLDAVWARFMSEPAR